MVEHNLGWCIHVKIMATFWFLMMLTVVVHEIRVADGPSVSVSNTSKFQNSLYQKHLTNGVFFSTTNSNCFKQDSIYTSIKPYLISIAFSQSLATLSHRVRSCVQLCGRDFGPEKVSDGWLHSVPHWLYPLWHWWGCHYPLCGEGLPGISIGQYGKVIS